MKRETETFLNSLLAMTRLIHRRMRIKCEMKCKLSPIQMQALAITRNAKSLTMKEFSDELGMNPSAATALAEGLVEKGYLKRRMDAKDRRSCHLELSSSGLKLINLKMERLAHELRSTVSVLSEQEQRVLVKLIQKIIEAHIS
jgi:DNA-binding MarR family transcriptional regulator